MAYTIESISRDVVKITIGSYDVEVTPVVIATGSYAEEEADISISPSVTPTANVYTLTGSPADEFEITFNADGVYKLYVIENSIDYLHIVIVTNQIDDFFAESIPNLITNSPLEEHSKAIKAEEHYDFDVAAILSMSFFGHANENVQLNYKDLTGGNLTAGQIYYCSAIGSGTYDWTNSAGDTLLVNADTGVALTSTAPTVDTYYKCIKSGSPVEWGSSANATFTLNHTTFEFWLYNVVDSIARFYKYSQDFIDS